jgi:endo-1,4-beta-xylanase
MVSFSSLFLVTCNFASALAAPSDSDVAKRVITTSQTGENNGYYFSFWTNGGGDVEYNNGKNGEYSVSWTNCGDFTSGKGWSTGSVLENYGTYNPGPSMTYEGSFTSDESVYDIYTHQQVNQPSIAGRTTFMQYWSIRRDKRSDGTVTTTNHFDAWASHGMKLGAHNYQIRSTEGFSGGGSAHMFIW